MNWFREIKAEIKNEWPALVISLAILYGIVYAGFRVTFR